MVCPLYPYRPCKERSKQVYQGVSFAVEAKQSGNSDAGRKVFLTSATGCAACHQIQGLNKLGPNANGPDLSAVAAGLPPELIIESIIWPKRQIKEGYEAAMLALKDEQVVTGYITNQDANSTSVRQMATNEVIVVPNTSIDKTVKIGTIMPEGLTTLLTRNELRDLVAYLLTLKN